MGCIRVLLSGKGAFHSRGNECDGHVTCDTFICKVPSMQKPAPGGGNTETVSSRPGQGTGCLANALLPAHLPTNGGLKPNMFISASSERSLSQVLYCHCSKCSKPAETLDQHSTGLWQYWRTPPLCPGEETKAREGSQQRAQGHAQN